MLKSVLSNGRMKYLLNELRKKFHGSRIRNWEVFYRDGELVLEVSYGPKGSNFRYSEKLMDNLHIWRT